MIGRLKRLIKEDQRNSNGFSMPVVLVGHSKDFWAGQNLEKFLSFAKKVVHENVSFHTLGEMTHMIIEKDGKHAASLKGEK